MVRVHQISYDLKAERDAKTIDEVCHGTALALLNVANATPVDAQKVPKNAFFASDCALRKFRIESEGPQPSRPAKGQSRISVPECGRCSDRTCRSLNRRAASSRH